MHGGVVMKKYFFKCPICDKTYTSISYEKVKKFGREHLKQVHMNYVIENMNKLNMSVNQAAGYLAAFNTREVENPSLNSSDHQDNKLPGI